MHIKAVHTRSRQSYGRRRVYAQLRQEGVCCSVGRVARLMRQGGLAGTRRHRYRATDSQHALPAAANLLCRNFTVAAPNRVRVSDISYLPCAAGWEYLATVLDLYNREIVGWTLSATLERSLTLRAMALALARRQPAPGPIHHSDRGVQYACGAYQAKLSQHGLRPSTSRKGDPRDNAAQESFFGTLKTELVGDWGQPSREQVQREVFDYIEVFYNRQRLHSALGYLSPVAFAARFAAKVA